MSAVDRADQLEARSYSAFGVVLMSPGITKIYEDTIAHVSGYEPVEALHGLDNAFLIGRDDLAQVLRIHASGQCRRTDQVEEHHCDLAALGGFLGADCRRRADGRQYFSSMPEWDADVLEVLIGQIAEDRDIDHVLGKALSVLGQTDLFEPITNIQHRSGRRTLASTILIANPLAAVTRELAAENPLRHPGRVVAALHPLRQKHSGPSWEPQSKSGD